MYRFFIMCCMPSIICCVLLLGSKGVNYSVWVLRKRHGSVTQLMSMGQHTAHAGTRTLLACTGAW